MTQIPFTIRFAEERKTAEPLPGEYDAEKGITMVSTSDGQQPLVTSAGHLSEIQTKTFVQRERDDEERHGLVELLTKTRVERESDD